MVYCIPLRNGDHTYRYATDYSSSPFLMRDLDNNFIFHRLPNHNYGVIGIAIGDTLEPLSETNKQKCFNLGWEVDESGYNDYMFDMTVKGALD